MHRACLLLVCGLGGGILTVGARAQDHWPQFRGPAGNGHATAKGLPVKWNESEKVKWKVAIHGKAWSSPVVWGDQIWVTSATEDGTQLYALGLDQHSGKIVHDRKIFEVERPQFAHKFNSYASPTPVIEAGRLYITFGAPGIACLDTGTGKVLWERRDFACNHFRGAGSSPILYQNLLLMNFDGSDRQYVAALDKHTGQTVWQVNRSIDYNDLTPEGQPQAEGDYRKAFATPHVAVIGNRPVLLSQGAKAQYGYDPLTGKEYWRVEERSCHSASGRAVLGQGMIFMTCGFSRGLLLALRPDLKDGAKAPAVVWKVARSMPNKPSPLLVEDLIFVVDDGGLASCLAAETGAEIWHERLGGNYSASPLYAEGRLYFFSEEGKTTVLKAARQFTKLAENHLAAGFMASPAVSGKALILRTKTHLYRIEE